MESGRRKSGPGHLGGQSRSGLIDVVVRLGGRTHKNKTGFDLVRLVVGSEGLLAVVTQATLKLLPLPQVSGVASTDPVVTIQVSSASAKAVYDRSTGVATPSFEPAIVTISFNSALTQALAVSPIMSSLSKPTQRLKVCSGRKQRPIPPSPTGSNWTFPKLNPASPVPGVRRIAYR